MLISCLSYFITTVQNTQRLDTNQCFLPVFSRLYRNRASEYGLLFVEPNTVLMKTSKKRRKKRKAFDLPRGPSMYYVSKEVGGGWSEKLQFFLIFSTIYADVDDGGWV